MKQLDTAKGWMGSGAAAIVIVGALSWVLLFSPKLSHASDLRSEAASLDVTNQALAVQVADLKEKQANLDQYVSRLAKARTGLPIAESISEFSAECEKHAGSAGVILKSMTVGEVSVVGAAAQATTTTATTDDTTVSTSATGATPGQLYGTVVTLVTDGPYAKQVRFLNLLQGTGARLALVSGARFAGTEDATDLAKASSLTTSLMIFTAPQSPEDAQHLRQQLAGHS